MNQAPISFKLSVWVAHPGPPQVRARAINAHGSSFQPSRPAIRRCFVDTSTGSDAPAMFPANGQLKRRPLHSAGSFGRVPPPQRYYGTLRLPAAHLAALRFLRLAIPSFRPLFVPASSGRELRIHLELVSRDSNRQSRRKRQGLSGSRATLVSLRPVLGPRYDRSTPGHCGASARPPLVTTTVAPASRRFRGSIARHWDSLSTLRNGGRPPPRKTRFRLLAKLCRAGFVNPQGCNERFPTSSLFPRSRAYLTLCHLSPPFTTDRCEMVENRRHRPRRSSSAHRASFPEPHATTGPACEDDRRRRPKLPPPRSEPPRDPACRRRRTEGSARGGRVAARGWF